MTGGRSIISGNIGGTPCIASIVGAINEVLSSIRLDLRSFPNGLAPGFADHPPSIDAFSMFVLACRHDRHSLRVIPSMLT
jgi:hypothetical protein